MCVHQLLFSLPCCLLSWLHQQIKIRNRWDPTELFSRKHLCFFLQKKNTPSTVFWRKHLCPQEKTVLPVVPGMLLSLLMYIHSLFLILLSYTLVNMYYSDTHRLRHRDAVMGNWWILIRGCTTLFQSSPAMQIPRSGFVFQAGPSRDAMCLNLSLSWIWLRTQDLFYPLRFDHFVPNLQL